MATKTGPPALPFYFNGHHFDQTNIGDGKLTTPKAGSYNYILVGCKHTFGDVLHVNVEHGIVQSASHQEFERKV